MLKTRLLGLFVLLLTAGGLAHASPVTLNFDDIDTAGGDVGITSPYGGLDWSNMTAYRAEPGFPGFNHGIVSQRNAVYSGGEYFGQTGVTPIVGAITAVDGLFDFYRAYLGAGYYDDLDLTFTGLRGGATLFSETVNVDTTGARLFTFGFTGIDTLDISASTTGSTGDPYACGTFNCTQFTMDNATVELHDVNTVPEPGSLLLTVTSLAAMSAAGAAARRRRAA